MVLEYRFLITGTMVSLFANPRHCHDVLILMSKRADHRSKIETLAG